MVFREASSHHVGHSESFHPQQVEDHGVGQSELGLEDGRLTLEPERSQMNQSQLSSI